MCDQHHSRCSGWCNPLYTRGGKTEGRSVGSQQGKWNHGTERWWTWTRTTILQPSWHDILDIEAANSSVSAGCSSAYKRPFESFLKGGNNPPLLPHYRRDATFLSCSVACLPFYCTTLPVAFSRRTEPLPSPTFAITTLPSPDVLSDRHQRRASQVPPRHRDAKRWFPPFLYTQVNPANHVLRTRCVCVFILFGSGMLGSVKQRDTVRVCVCVCGERTRGSGREWNPPGRDISRERVRKEERKRQWSCPLTGGLV